MEVIRGISSARRSQMLSSGKYMSALVALFYLREEKLEQNLVRKPLLLTLMTNLLQCNNCYSNFGMFIHVHRWPSSSPIQFSLDDPSSWHHFTYGTSKAGHGNNQGRKGPGQSEDWILSHRQSLILIRFTHAVAKLYISCGKRWA